MKDTEQYMWFLGGIVFLLSFFYFVSHVHDNITINEMVAKGVDPIVAACSVGSISCNSCVKSIEKK